VRDAVAGSHADTVREVQAAIAANAVVVVGMAQNPFPKKARRLLDAKGVAYKYLEYGSYLGGWRQRTALKMWAGWPTFPMVFVKGVLVGGANDLKKLVASGELAKLLA
jgi:glutaredoxin-related protein